MNTKDKDIEDAVRKWKAEQRLKYPQENDCYYNWLGQKILKTTHPDYVAPEISNEKKDRSSTVITNQKDKINDY